MVNSIMVTNYLGETLELELRAPEQSGLSIIAVEGIDPPKAQINMTKFGTIDGSKFRSKRVLARDIMLYIKPYTPSDISVVRRKIYKYFALGRKVKLQFNTDGRTAYCEGYVEDNEISIFSRNQISQISIRCESPYFYAPYISNTVIAGVEKLFEFPFGGEDTFEFGRYRRNNGVNVIYEGDAETGVVIKMHASGDVSNITVYNSATRDLVRIDTDILATLTGNAMIAGDDIIISTIVGDKYAKLIRDGVETNIMNTLERPIRWLKLSKGDNVFAYDCESGESDLVMTIENPILYEGI